MKTYHFSCGNSTEGAVGLCARVDSETAEDALSKLRHVLEAGIGSFGELPLRIGGPDIEYVTIYISPGNITAVDINEESEIDAR